MAFAYAPIKSMAITALARKSMNMSRENAKTLDIYLNSPIDLKLPDREHLRGFSLTVAPVTSGLQDEAQEYTD